MPKQTRRDFIKSAGAITAASALGVGLGNKAFAASSGSDSGLLFKPEDGAKLNVLRWTRFVQGDAEQWAANTKKFTEQTGVEVSTGRAAMKDIRAKSALTARMGAGPDIILGWFDDPHKFPQALMDVTDVAEHLGKKYGGWYDVCRAYGMKGDKWIGLPACSVGNNLLYKKSKLQAAGFDRVPENLPDFLKMAQALKKNGTPMGLALGHSVLDANDWTYWVWWAFGGKLADKDGNVVLNSPETVESLKYAKKLYESFIPGTTSWLDSANNQAFFADKIALTMNGISIYYSALHATDPKKHAMADDIICQHMPIGPVGKPTELHGLSQMMLFNHCQYPNAAKAYMQFMMEKEQYGPWLKASLGYTSQTLKNYEKLPFWTSGSPNITVYRDVCSRSLTDGYDGPLGIPSASTMSSYVIVDMIANAVSGAKSFKQAASDAADRAKRFYDNA